MQVSLSDKSFLPKTALIFSVKKVTKCYNYLNCLLLSTWFYNLIALSTATRKNVSFFTKHFHCLIHDI